MLLNKNLRKISRHRLYYIIIIPFLLLLYTIYSLHKSILSISIQVQVSQTSLANDQIESNGCKKLCPYSSILTNVTVKFDASNRIKHFPNFVCPQNFRNLADWVYSWPDQFHEKLTKTTDQGKDIAPCLPSGSIIYVRQWAVTDFFDKVYPHLKNDFVLITGEGDVSSPTHLEKLEAADSKIIHWFGQNGQYDVTKIKKFTHIPIGNLFLITISFQTRYFDRTD